MSTGEEREFRANLLAELRQMNRSLGKGASDSWLGVGAAEQFLDSEVRVTAHSYTSTACVHALHRRCRNDCKFCAAQCECACHGSFADAEKEIERLQQESDRLGEQRDAVLLLNREVLRVLEGSEAEANRRLATVWNEGYRKGCEDEKRDRGPMPSHSGPATQNPYRVS